MTVVISLIVGVMLVVFVLQQSDEPGNDISFGTSVFEAGKVDPLARSIARDGPVFYRAPSKGGPDIYIQHVGANSRSGWHVFDARADGQDRNCTLTWQPAAQQFVEPCSKAVFPADGTGMRKYKAVVLGDRLTVDFRAPP